MALEIPGALSDEDARKTSMKRTIRRWVYGVRLAAYFAIHDPNGIKYPLHVYTKYFDRREHNTKGQAAQ